ncbi:hypothetical protein GF324_07310 [bacterium]|nr:hypothetical protein [bacterium]
MLSQQLTGALLRDPVAVQSSDLETIRALPNPPLTNLAPEDIYVRRCRLACDAIDSRGGRFRREDMPRLLEMVQGAPVLIGHDKRSLGVARFFGGEVEQRGEVRWIVPKFYFPRAHSGSEDLKVMIDSGVYTEASIAFLYEKPTCSICGEDLRSCPHWPGRSYDNRTCHFWYDGIQRVTEGSLVYRGAAPGTGFELLEDESHADERTPQQDATAKTLRLKRGGRVYLASLRPLK